MSGSVWQDTEGNLFAGSGDATIHYAIDSRKHTVTIVQADGGIGYANGSSEPILVEEGATVTITAKSYRGYAMGGYQITSGTVREKNGRQFVMGDEDVTIVIQFLWSPNYYYYDPTGAPTGTAGRG